MTPTLGQQWETRLREIFPLDLPPSRPLYLLSDLEVPAGFGCFAQHGVGAYTSPSLNLRLKHHLRRMGRWKGVGFVVIFRLWMMLEMNESAQAGLFIHEIGHALDLANVLPLLQESAACARVATGPNPVELFATDTAPKVPWASHAEHFTRAVGHLHYRAALAGLTVELPDLHVAGERYGLSSAEAYAETLRDEVHDRAGEPIETILESPVPAKLVQVFASDRLRFFDEEFARQIAAGRTDDEAFAALAALKTI